LALWRRQSERNRERDQPLRARCALGTRAPSAIPTPRPGRRTARRSPWWWTMTSCGRSWAASDRHMPRPLVPTA